jgi:hypothetical protein
VIRSEEEVKKDDYLEYPERSKVARIIKRHDLWYFDSCCEYKADDIDEPEYYTLAQALLTSIRSGIRLRYLEGCQGNWGNTKRFHTDIQELPDLSLANYKDIVPSSRTKDFKDFADLVRPHFNIVQGYAKRLDQEKIDYVVKQKDLGVDWDDTWGVWSAFDCPNDYMEYRFIFNNINKLDRGQFLTPEVHAKVTTGFIPRGIKYVWDPFVGNWGLLKYAEDAGYTIFGSDLYPVTKNTYRADFFRDAFIPEEIKDDPDHSFILTNPTFENHCCDKAIDKCLKLGIRFGMFVLDFSLKSRPLPIVDGFYTYSNDKNKKLCWPELCDIGGGQCHGIPFLLFDPSAKYVKSIKIGDNIFDCVKPSDALSNTRWDVLRNKVTSFDTFGKMVMISRRLKNFPELFGRFPVQSDIDKYYDPKWEINFKGKYCDPTVLKSDVIFPKTFPKVSE